jgi:hypothetical protein
MYDLAIKRLNADLKCLEGPAHIVKPGVRPPSSLPLNATFTIGIPVGIISFSLKNFDFERIDASLIVEFFLILSNKLIIFP